LQKIWNEYGSWIIAGLVILLLATAGASAYKSWNNGAKEKQTSVFLNVLKDENFPKGVDLDALNMRGDLTALTALMAAGQLIQDDKEDEARAFYVAASQTKGASSDYRDLGFVMAARLLGDAPDADTMKGLLKIFKNKKSPWRYQAGVDLAVMSFHHKNDVQTATDYLNAVIVAAQEPKNKIPPTLEDRAKNLLHVYTTRGSKSDGSKDAAQETAGE
jgi:hypothetical protein